MNRYSTQIWWLPDFLCLSTLSLKSCAKRSGFGDVPAWFRLVRVGVLLTTLGAGAVCVMLLVIVRRSEGPIVCSAQSNTTPSGLQQAAQAGWTAPLRVTPERRPLIPLSAEEATWLAELIQPPPPGKGNVSDILHVLRVHGLDEHLLDERFVSGNTLLTVLTHDSIGAEFFGDQALVTTPYGARFPTNAVGVTGAIASFETHRDQCLAAFAELGLPLSLSLIVDGPCKTLRDVFADSMANFFLQQDELEWTALAYGLYVPPMQYWENRYGERTTFDELVVELLDRPLSRSTCAGTHRLYTLTILARIDREQSRLFSKQIQERLQRWLEECVQIARAAQNGDGSFNLDWHPESLPENTGMWTPAHDSHSMQVLATGHLAEWMLYLPEDLQVPDEVLRRAGTWCLRQLQAATAQEIGEAFCPYTHCCRVVRQLSFGQKL